MTILLVNTSSVGLLMLGLISFFISNKRHINEFLFGGQQIFRLLGIMTFVIFAERIMLIQGLIDINGYFIGSGFLIWGLALWLMFKFRQKSGK